MSKVAVVKQIEDPRRFQRSRKSEFSVVNGVGISLVDIVSKPASVRAVSSETVSMKIALENNEMPVKKIAGKASRWYENLVRVITPFVNMLVGSDSSLIAIHAILKSNRRMFLT